MLTIPVPAAGAWVGCCHEGDRGREDGVPMGAAEPHPSLFEGLAQLIQHGTPEFRQFIKKKNTAMGEAEFAGSGIATSTKQGDG